MRVPFPLYSSYRLYYKEVRLMRSEVTQLKRMLGSTKCKTEALATQVVCCILCMSKVHFYVLYVCQNSYV